MPDRFRKKPIEVSAVQWDGENTAEVAALLGIDDYDPVRETRAANRRAKDDALLYVVRDEPRSLIVRTVHGEPASARVGDWVIPEPVPGRGYPVRADIFAATYDPAPADVDVRWGSSELTDAVHDPEANEMVPPGVFLTCRGDDPEDIRAVLRIEHAVAEDGTEASRPLAAQLAALLNEQAVLPTAGEVAR